VRDGGQVVHTGETVAEPVTEAAVVTRATAATVIDRGAGVRTIHLTARDRGAVQFLNGITEFAERAELPLHWHNCEESVVVIEGQATIEAGDERHTLGPGDAVRVPAELPHRFLNDGPERLRILWTYGRADATRTLAATGIAFRVGEEPKQPA
jgi:mannose-6-phosphate isomerase-like protein (cupin superfamily)